MNYLFLLDIGRQSVSTMGEQNVNLDLNNALRTSFIEHLLTDIKSLEQMLEQGMIEDDITRIGAEQEFCLVNNNWRPSQKSVEILEAINDPHFTTELARYNLEINLDPIKLEGKCFSKYEKSLDLFLEKAATAAAEKENRVILAGILPTISKNELGMDFMTPSPRYYALNDTIKAHRGKDIDLRIRGIDQLSIIHDSVLFEACNTSFQMHLQIAPDDFISSYNWAQAISGPLLSICCNSPLLLGRELWSETRIALFQQSIDTRSSSFALKDQRARVTFGNAWVSGSIAEIFKDDIARYKLLIAREIEQNSSEELAKGNTPKLQALNLHNGTIYHWNRCCYGVGNGKAHVRIENRYIPAGPTVKDEIANFAFWIGMMMGRPKEFDDMESVMEFRDAKSNFIKAARTGKESVLRWKGEQYSARELITKELLPIARVGLERAKIAKEDIDYYLGIIEERLTKETASRWCIRNYRKLKQTHKKDDALLMLTKAMHANQKIGHVSHDWPEVDPSLEAHEAAYMAAHIMSTELFTVTENDLADLATSVMLWKNIHHLPVENKKGELCGLLTWSHLEKYRKDVGNTEALPVSDIMTKDIITVRPETTIENALVIMKKNSIGCVPVTHDQHMVGIITIDDILPYDNGKSV
ncbi:CBS domain-containing protein [Marivirga sericea]|uniref:CBS domain-containing protein n=1 Tax=Marivirga sericea TaxID=1028 RepID=A0A1X7IFH0_9BACT|nr:CBS domain-containing protein [Marivirga sericea]SMG13059.1 CBS domain-containing protein [Marivirga sericea]